MDEPYIIFFEQSHTYWKSGKRIPSVGKYLDKIYPTFEKQYWLTHSTLKELLGEMYVTHYRNTSEPKTGIRLFSEMLKTVDTDALFSKRDEIRDRWDLKGIKSAWKGTKFHQKREARAYRTKRLKNPFTKEWFPVTKHDKQYDNQTLTDNLYDLPDGAYLELLVFDPEHPICGLIDEVFLETIDGVRYADVNDSKTMAEKPGEWSKDFLAEPVSSYRASKHNKFLFQISFYMKMLTRHGFVPRNTAYTWYKDANEKLASLIEFPYLSNEMDTLYEFFFN